MPYSGEFHFTALRTLGTFRTMSASRRFPRSRFQPGIPAMYACTGASPSAFAMRGLPPERTTATLSPFRTLIGLASLAPGLAFAPAFAGTTPRAAPAPPAAPRCRACAARRSSELHLRVYRFFAGGPFWATAAFTSALNAPASTFSPSWMSIALRVLPSKLELKRRDGSGILAPRANVSFTTFVYASPVQTIPWCDQTGVPIHFHSSVISGSASRISARMQARVSPRHPPRSRIRWSMSREAGATGLAFAPAFDGDLDVVADVRGLLARDVPLAFGFALPGLRAVPAGAFMVMAAPRRGS